MIDGATLEKVEEVLEERHPDKNTPFYAVERHGSFIFCDESFLFQVPQEDVEDSPELDWLLKVAEDSAAELEHVNALKYGTKGWKDGYPTIKKTIAFSDPTDEELDYFDCDLAVVDIADERVYYCQAYLSVMGMIFGRVYYKICSRSPAWPLVVYKHRRPVGVIMNMLWQEDDDDDE